MTGTSGLVLDQILIEESFHLSENTTLSGALTLYAFNTADIDKSLRVAMKEENPLELNSTQNV